VVTEHGVARLRGRTLAERARLLIGVAAPEHRDELEREALELGILPRRRAVGGRASGRAERPAAPAG
jgi:acyl-CoA hydrolase